MTLSPTLIPWTFRDLRLERTRADMMRAVYYVHKGEKIGYVVRKIRKNTLVFVSANGTPVLLQICGNPLRQVSIAALTVAQPIGNDLLTNEVETLAKSVFDSDYALREAVPETAMLPSRIADDLLLEERPLFHFRGPESAGATSAFLTVPSSLSGPLGALAVAGLFAAAVGSHTLPSAQELMGPIDGSSGPGSPSMDFPNDGSTGSMLESNTPSPIPEPAFYQMSALLLLGGIGLLLMRSKP